MFLMDAQYQAYRELKRHLGEIDAVVELAELAIRYMKSQEPLRQSRDWYNDLCARLGVKINPDGLLNEEQRRSRIFIVAIHTGLERFLYELRREVSELRQEQPWELNQGESRLTSATKAVGLPPPVSDEVSQQLVVSVLDYYRQIRNCTVHTHAAEPAVPKNADRVGVYYRLAAPNALTSLTFDDVILFTRLVKDFGRALSSHIAPTIPEMAKSVQVAKYTKFRNNPGRWIAAVATETRTRWSTSVEIAQQVGRAAAQLNGLLDQR